MIEQHRERRDAMAARMDALAAELRGEDGNYVVLEDVRRRIETTLDLYDELRTLYDAKAAREFLTWPHSMLPGDQALIEILSTGDTDVARAVVVALVDAAVT